MKKGAVTSKPTDDDGQAGTRAMPEATLVTQWYKLSLLAVSLGKSPQLVLPGKTNSIRTKASATADSMALELSPSKTAVCSQRIHCHCVRASMAEGIWGKREACLDRLERLVCLIKQSLLELVLCKKLAYLLITWETHL